MKKIALFGFTTALITGTMMSSANADEIFNWKNNMKQHSVSTMSKKLSIDTLVNEHSEIFTWKTKEGVMKTVNKAHVKNYNDILYSL